MLPGGACSPRRTARSPPPARACGSSRRSPAPASTPRSAAVPSRYSTPPSFAARRFFLSRMHVQERSRSRRSTTSLREVTAGIEHVWRDAAAAPDRVGATVALLVVGFAETLIFSVIACAREAARPSSASSPRSRESARSPAGSRPRRSSGASARCALVGIGLGLFAARRPLPDRDRRSRSCSSPGRLAGVGVAGRSSASRPRSRRGRRSRSRVASRRPPTSTLSIAQTTSIAHGRVALHGRRLPDPVRRHGGSRPRQRRLPADAAGADSGACDDGGVTELVPLRRNRDFVLYQSGGLLSTFGSGISGIAYPLLALALTALGGEDRLRRRGRVLAARPAERAAGVAADRFDRRRLMIAADAAGATALARAGRPRC